MKNLERLQDEYKIQYELYKISRSPLMQDAHYNKMVSINDKITEIVHE